MFLKKNFTTLDDIVQSKYFFIFVCKNNHKIVIDHTIFIYKNTENGKFYILKMILNDNLLKINNLNRTS